jgi:DnaA-homolog protein
MRQLSLAILQAPPPSFDNFVPGANGEALARLREAAEGGSREAVIYLWGEPGSGRTHLLRAAAHEALEAAYLTAGSGLVAAAARLLAVDDVEQLGEEEQVALFQLINRAREGAAIVLAAGNVPPGQLALREDLRSRLGWGLVYQIKALSDADKALWLRAAAERRGLRLADEVVWYLLTHVRRDMPSLNAILEHLDRYSLERRRPVTLPLVREALQELEA